MRLTVATIGMLGCALLGWCATEHARAQEAVVAPGPMIHLRDGEEFSTSIAMLLARGAELFKANWTQEQGGGRPLTKGTGRPLADPSQPLSGHRVANRVSAPDANSCASCHNAPYGIVGGGRLRHQRVRSRTALRLRDLRSAPTSCRPRARWTKRANRRRSRTRGFPLDDRVVRRGLSGDAGAADHGRPAANPRTRSAPVRPRNWCRRGVHFGRLTLTMDGLWDTSKVDGSWSTEPASRRARSTRRR